MKYIKYLFLFLLPACKGPAASQSAFVAPIRSDSNQLTIAGSYDDLARDGKTSLWNTFSQDKPGMHNGRGETVKISTVSKKQITMGLYASDTLIATKSFKYKIKGDFIVISRRTKTDWPVGPLIWTLNTRRLLLARNKEDQLLFVDYGSTIAFFVIMPLTGAEYSPLATYDRVSK